MMVSIRLDEGLDRLLARTARALGRTRSEIVKAALREYCRRELLERQARPYELVKDVIGRVDSGRGDLSTNSRKYILEILHAKRIARSR
ncbi:MAG: ribbon-helix-helix protein, CopG family [Candidatus Rokubacteria bacterium]|nr:ribbon-helix-helix protein, CopG family [Candidatus Rokubacteria bacterium]